MLGTGGGSIVNLSSIYGLAGRSGSSCVRVLEARRDRDDVKSVALEVATPERPRERDLRWRHAHGRDDSRRRRLPDRRARSSSPSTLDGGAWRPRPKIAGAVLWLCSDASGFVTGSPLLRGRRLPRRVTEEPTRKIGQNRVDREGNSESKPHDPFASSSQRHQAESSPAMVRHERRGHHRTRRNGPIGSGDGAGSGPRLLPRQSAQRRVAHVAFGRECAGESLPSTARPVVPRRSLQAGVSALSSRLPRSGFGIKTSSVIR